MIRRRALECLLLCMENNSCITWLRHQNDSTVQNLIAEIHHVLIPPKSALQRATEVERLDGVVAAAEEEPEDEDLPRRQTAPALSPFHQQITQLAALLDDANSGVIELEADVVLGLSDCSKLYFSLKQLTKNDEKALS